MIYLCCVNLDVTKKSHLDNELVCSIVAAKKKIRNEIRKIFKSRYTAVEHIAYSENL